MTNSVRNIKYVYTVHVNLQDLYIPKTKQNGNSYRKNTEKCTYINILLWQYISLLLDQIKSNI
jgi:hypothetical protein